MVIGTGGGTVLPMDGALPPDLQGTFFRVGPAHPDAVAHQAPSAADTGGSGTGTPTTGTDAPPEGVPESAPGALHAVELRDGVAVSYLRCDSPADAGVLWHAGSLLALPEVGLPSRYTRLLEPQQFAGGLSVPIASHVHRVAHDGSRVLFAVDDRSEETEGVVLRVGEWDAAGALHGAQVLPLDRATWIHDAGVTAGHVVLVESPTTPLPAGPTGPGTVPYAWVPGASIRLGIVPRGGDGSGARWVVTEPCLVTHVLGASEDDRGALELFVCRYDAPEDGRPVDRSASVVGPRGIGLSALGGGLAVLERWQLTGGRLTRAQVDERHVEHPRIDPACEGAAFRHGYCVETAWDDRVTATGLLKFDLTRDAVSAWRPPPGCEVSEPVFVRAVDGRNDDEGWILVVVDDPGRGAADLYVLDASALGRRGPEAVVHLPVRLPLRSHGEWVPADRYR